MLLQAPAATASAVGLGCAAAFQPADTEQPGQPVVYELRRYRLRPGNDGVKRVMAALQEG
jgi:hypothetical protein